jgi:hypothetical protein
MNPSRMRHTLPKQKLLGAVLATCAMLVVATAAFAEPVLKADAFKHHVEKFNAEDNELYKNTIPNAKAWGFLAANIPLFECPDEEMERTYYFRWWTYRKHLAQSPDGWVVTEFLPQVSWSGKHNTISCPAGHHFHEGRWLADQTFLDQYATFWFQKGGNPRLYSFWAAEAIYSFYLTTRNKTLVTGLLDDLVKNYKAWEESRLTADGLFWQIDDRDGMEVSVGKSGKRATINSYMFGDAVAIARIAELAGRGELATVYQQKAEKLRQLVQSKLWDGDAKFFKTLQRSPAEMVTPKNSLDGSVPRLHWMDSEHRGTREWVQYRFPKMQKIDSVEVYWVEGGQALVKPESWRILVLKGEEWIPVKNHGDYSVALDVYNKVAFDPVETDSIRLEVQSAKGKSAGIIEWRAIGGGKNIAAGAKITKSYDIKMGRNNSIQALNDGADAATVAGWVDVRELHGYTPWYFNLPQPDKGYEVAWKQLMDPKGFLAPFGPTTAEQRHAGFLISYEGHGCQWNGPSWPFATAQTITAMANVLRNYKQDAVSKNDYFKILEIYTRSHHRKTAEGNSLSWIDENLDPFTGEWIARKRCEEHNEQMTKAGKLDQVLRERGKDYNHSSYCDLIITGLVGLQPRADNIVEVQPLVPDDKWDWFCLDNISYHGKKLTILWDKTGEKYKRGKGLRVFANDREISRSDKLERVTGQLPD